MQTDYPGRNQPSLLDELHRDGDTLVISYLGWQHKDVQWVREQEHAIVGYQPERRFILCKGSEDLSDIQTNWSGEQAMCCEFCKHDRSHTEALHLQEIPF